MARPKAGTDEAVLTVLRGAETPMSAYQVLDRLRPEGIQSPPVVYRSLDRLQKAGQIHRLEALNAYFACCGRDHTKGIVFAVCTECRRVEEWSGEGIDGLLADRAGRAGFEIASRTIEVTGLCAACRGEVVAERHELHSHGPGCGCGHADDEAK